MSTVNVSLQTAVQQFPAGTVSAGIAISILSLEADGALYQPQVLTSEPFKCTFLNVTPGKYKALAQALDKNSLPLGAEVSVEFIVDAPLVDVIIPIGITAVVV